MKATLRMLSRKSKYWVYIVQCRDGTYYTGYTNDLEKRIDLHNSGNGAKYLRSRIPVKLVYAKEYHYYKNALRRERNIKKMTREQKERLIRIYNENNNQNQKDMDAPTDLPPILLSPAAASCDASRSGKQESWGDKSKRGSNRV
jgi:putative endonuclease